MFGNIRISVSCEILRLSVSILELLQERFRRVRLRPRASVDDERRNEGISRTQIGENEETYTRPGSKYFATCRKYFLQ